MVTFPSLCLMMEIDTDLETILKKTQDNGQCQKYVYSNTLPSKKRLSFTSITLLCICSSIANFKTADCSTCIMTQFLTPNKISSVCCHITLWCDSIMFITSSAIPTAWNHFTHRAWFYGDPMSLATLKCS